jgi:hypothetical protein
MFIFFQLLLTLRIDLVQSILHQKERDDNVGHLLEVMADAYAFVLEAEPVKKIESHKRIVTVMVQQTTECSYFIREYATNASFSMSLSVYKTTKSHDLYHFQGNASLNIFSQMLTTR